LKGRKRVDPSPGKDIIFSASEWGRKKATCSFAAGNGKRRNKLPSGGRKEEVQPFGDLELFFFFAQKKKPTIRGKDFSKGRGENESEPISTKDKG